MAEFQLSGIERKVQGDALVPIGGKLPYYLEVPTGRLLDYLFDLAHKDQTSRSDFRKKINKWIYVRTRPGFYLELNDHVHLAYADQRDGHGTQHWWRLFFDEVAKPRIEQLTRSSALTIGQPKSSSNNHRGSNPDANSYKEWGGMYFRSEAEIRIAEALDQAGLLFFANARGRFSTDGSTTFTRELPGRIETDFLVFRKGKCIVLEIDGQHHNEGAQTLRDYIRDRVLLREGLPTVRFAASECFAEPTAVVKEVLEILSE